MNPMALPIPATKFNLNQFQLLDSSVEASLDDELLYASPIPRSSELTLVLLVIDRPDPLRSRLPPRSSLTLARFLALEKLLQVAMQAMNTSIRKSFTRIASTMLVL
ncbi:hypothetical protein CCR75_007120 [Bremia lactucae]|uniref:Uncharacterized protein n=1 Tax=Bremia lactucae TaxID=4779 RepID=A0A976FFY9_BRELC|nr:hypothetical protein CCR75_007120 [Bremia lactucae]